jgi:hypothetical protein
MSLDLPTILPNVTYSFDSVGFLFGAGTSVEAGYPNMSALTRNVVQALIPDEMKMMDEVLAAVGQSYDSVEAKPNIEELSDFVIAHSINSHDHRCSALEGRFRELIVREILSIRDPDIESHVQFFRALKQRTFGRPCTVWVFTTNYDLLLEVAAAKAGVIVENGFSGATERFFNPGQFRVAVGEVTGKQFTPNNQLTVKLVKLHGSVSWTNENGNLYERHPAALTGAASRVMVLPRRAKVMDTLAPPYDTLFAYARRVIGDDCKYLISCGFSYGDDHINQHLVLPALQSGRARLFALNEFESPGTKGLRALPTFRAGYSNELQLGDGTHPTGTDLWRFSKFVKLF